MKTIHYTHDSELLPPDYHLAITVVVHIGIIFQSPVEAIYRYYRATHSLPWMHATTVEKITQTSSRMACTSKKLSNGLLQRASFAQNAIIMVGREANPEQQTIRFTLLNDQELSRTRIHLLIFMFGNNAVLVSLNSRKICGTRVSIYMYIFAIKLPLFL